MSPLAVRIGAGALALLALIALRGKRWAYLAFVLLGLAYFPTQPHFRVHVPKCELLLPTMQMLVLSLHNYAYIALFAGFCWMSWVQFRRSDLPAVWAIVATLFVGALVEIAEGMTRGGHCRVRDLMPAAAGALGAAVLLAIWSRLTRKPAYVRIVRPASRAAAAPRVAGPPPRPSLPPRALVYEPPAYAPPPPPPDFSPGPVTAASQAAPTEQVARTKRISARTALAQHLRPILQRLEPILGRLRTIWHRFWAIIRGGRRAIVIGIVVVALGAAGAFVLSRLSAPAVTEQPAAPPPEPPPPPPRPLQAEVEGYYEPNYEFTVFDRRFTRVTLRPHASVTFARFATRQQVECEDARINRDAVHLRCTIEPVGLITIEGRFPARYATSKLDMPVLSALITVSTTGGEIVYRAHDSFYWHVPDPEP